MIAQRVVVHGDVQGVGFRWWAAREAGRLGVRGWVANRDDGTVELHVEGDAAAVDELVGLLHEGPRWAHVARVVVRDDEPSGRVGFELEP